MTTDQRRDYVSWLRSVCRAGYAGGWRVFGLCAASPTRCPSPNGSMYGNIYWREPAVTEGVGDNFEVELRVPCFMMLDGGVPTGAA